VAGAEGATIAEILSRACHRAVSVIGAAGDRMALTANTTTGLNVVAWGLDWAPGDARIHRRDVAQHLEQTRPQILRQQAGFHRHALFDGLSLLDVCVFEHVRDRSRRSQIVERRRIDRRHVCPRAAVDIDAVHL
jgi:hypothetical protein